MLFIFFFGFILSNVYSECFFWSSVIFLATLQSNIFAYNYDFSPIYPNNRLRNIRTPANMSLLGNVTWAVSNLCRGKPPPDLQFVRRAIEFLSMLITKEIAEYVRVDAVWALSYLSDGGNDRIALVMENDTTDTLLSSLETQSSTLLRPTIKCLGNFVTGSDFQREAALDAGILPHLPKLLDNPTVSEQLSPLFGWLGFSRIFSRIFRLTIWF